MSFKVTILGKSGLTYAIKILTSVNRRKYKFFVIYKFYNGLDQPIKNFKTEVKIMPKKEKRTIERKMFL